MELYTFIEGIVVWLVSIVQYILNVIGLHGLADWLGGAEIVNILTYLGQALIVFLVGFVICLTMIWQERKTLGRLMDRRGTRIGPLGYAQQLADGFKTFLKEIIVPDKAWVSGYNWALIILIASSVILVGIIPLSDGWFLSSTPAGLLLLFAVFSLAPFAILIGGWASNNKYTLIGGMRSAAQLISYEVPLLLSTVGVILLAGSLSFGDIVAAQDTIWFVIPQIIGFIIFMIAMNAEVERIPFDLPEAEAELVEGWGTEYGGLRFGLIMFAEYLRGYAGAAIAAILFLGGWNGPYLPPELWLLIKVFIIFFVFIWIRGSFPRVRTDQILNIGWKWLMPLAMINLAIAVAFKMLGWF
ncbi:MAG: NADH-quinone oxidoreductase subunit NuoH [Methanomassiliicoccales archaeon]|nr:NADH-quinone oxidoreductase subunit NuoH [Methanomassiliicoccales archaeon]NYT15051.1 NADH-quinone oxidoreductase subunit NuoH [Methanomassiliicoccales archaeon]